MKTTRSMLVGEVLGVLAYNAAVALYLTAITPHGLGVNLVFTNCIGLSSYAFVRGSCLLRRRNKPGWFDALVGIPAGIAVGFVLGSWADGKSPAQVMAAYPQVIVIAAATGSFFSVIAVYHFRSQIRMQEAQAEAQAERLRRMEQEALTTRAELAGLQAQIEPHFLFNTLSNVVGLIDTDPAAARTMLLDLTALLRTSLARSRRTDVTLAEELELLRAYLGIMGIRMGRRLAWNIEADDTLLAMQLPPLLLQPLVENAVRHGLEPRTEGGTLTIRCRRDHARALIEVEDGGGGFADAVGEGVGLRNVRQRLKACYGEAAALSLETNPAGGVTARLELPCAPCVS